MIKFIQKELLGQPFWWRITRWTLTTVASGVRLELLNLSSGDIWGQIILCCGDCPVHCRMMSSIPDSTHEIPAALPLAENHGVQWIQPNANSMICRGKAQLPGGTTRVSFTKLEASLGEWPMVRAQGLWSEWGRVLWSSTHLDNCIPSSQTQDWRSNTGLHSWRGPGEETGLADSTIAPQGGGLGDSEKDLATHLWAFACPDNSIYDSHTSSPTPSGSSLLFRSQLKWLSRPTTWRFSDPFPAATLPWPCQSAQWCLASKLLVQNLSPCHTHTVYIYMDCRSLVFCLFLPLKYELHEDRDPVSMEYHTPPRSQWGTQHMVDIPTPTKYLLNWWGKPLFHWMAGEVQ